ncbi:RNA helicase family protein, partial [Perilla frutescens var. frutescens]
MKRLDDCRSIDRSVMNELDAKIRDAVWKLEDVLESYQGVDEQEMDLLLKTVKLLREEYNRVLEEEDEALSTTVGLISDQSEEEIRNEIPLNVQCFDSRAWLKILREECYTVLQNPLSGEADDRQTVSFVGRAGIATQIYQISDSNTIGLSDLSENVINDFLGGWRQFRTVSLVGMAGIVTTRLQEVAEFHQLASNVHRMPFLNNEESWDLLRQNVFVAEKSFPPKLEKPGRKIAEKCEGLPLLILAVANILRGLDKTQDSWEKVAEKSTTTFTDAYDQIYESSEIPLSKLINLWDVEDFLEPMPDQKLEEFAMKSMEDLVSNSVAIVCKQSFESVRRIKSSKLHSVNWNLPKEVYDSMTAVTSTTRSLLCTGEDHQYPVRIYFNMILLKVLDAHAIRFYKFPEEVVKLLQLKYLTLTHNGELPSSIANLQQLQCLILRGHHNIIKLVQRDSSSLPDEIWDLQELRHVRIKGSNLPDPIKGTKLPKLSTLYVNANSCSENVLRSMPNLKKLGITIELQPDAAETIRWLEHVRILDRLESLKCVVVNPQPRSQSVVSLADDLSNWRWWHLKKMSLEGLGLSWNYMSAVGSLYCLEVLKLRCSAFQGPEWNTKAGQFQSLKYLLLEDIDLVHWTAEDKYFPRLCHLSVRHCYKLKEIPCQIGIADISIPKLLLEVDDCSPSVVDSVQKIKLKTTYSRLLIESLQVESIGDFTFAALQPPEPLAVQDAVDFLKMIGALDENENLTHLGTFLSVLPVDPKLSKMLIMGAIFCCFDPIDTHNCGWSQATPYNKMHRQLLKVVPYREAYELISHLYGTMTVQLDGTAKSRFSAKDYSDHMALVRAYEGWKDAEREGSAYEYCWRNFLSLQTLQASHSLRKQFTYILEDAGFLEAGGGINNRLSHNQSLVRAVICSGFIPVIASVVPRETSLSFKTMDDGPVFLYANSVNGRYQTIQYPWLVFGEKVKVNTVFIRDSTGVSDSILILFGGKLECGAT